MTLKGQKELFLLVALACVRPSPAAESPGPSWPRQAWNDFASPVTTDAKYFLLTGGGLLGGLLLLKNQIDDPLQRSTVKNRPLGEGSHYGDLAGRLWPNAIYALGMLGYGWRVPESRGFRNAAGMAQSTLYAAFVSTTLKLIVRERRPNDANVRTSFPSGHTTTAFAFASYIACRHAWPWGAAAYALATFVGYSRINDNAHYLRDVVAGATIGGSFGLGVCLAENQRAKLTKAGTTLSWNFAPASGGGVGNLLLAF